MPRPFRSSSPHFAAAATSLLAFLALGVSLAPGQGAPGPGADREQAYRANNLGVALLEQYRFADGVDQFKKAVAADPGYAQAQINLAIGLFYVPDLAAAKLEGEKALALAPSAPQPPYLLGLIARQENRPEDAERAFRLVQAKDPADVGATVNLGQVLLQQRRYDEAIPLLESAVKAEPYNVTATYNLGVALTRAGRRDEGVVVTKRFTELRESLYKTQFGQTYLEQGRYAEAVASTGAEPELVDDRSPGVSFVAHGDALPADLRGRTGFGRPALLDADGDGRLDLVLPSGAGTRLLRNEGGRFADASAAFGLAGRKGQAAIGADLDNDGKADLLLLQPLALLKNEGGTFKEPAAATGLPKESRAAAAALADLDHDGDLDVVLGDPEGVRYLRSGGDLTFADLTADTRLTGSASAFVATDFDNRRDLDLVVSRADGPPSLFKNRRDGSFEDVAADLGLAAGVTASPAVAAGDVNKDGFTDFFFGGPKTARLALSDGRGRFEAAAAPSLAEAEGGRAALFLDVDDDGLLDLVVAGEFGLRAYRNMGRDFKRLEIGAATGPLASLLAADLDEDGDVDLVASTPDGALRVLRNEGGNRNRSVRVALTGRVSNRTGIGAKVELRAGSLRQKLETYAATPAVAPDDVVFGLGRRTAADVVRVIWTSGIVQTETEFPPAGAAAPQTVALAVTELDRKPSSCPYLFAWNGQAFEFVTDFLGGGEMGYWLAPGLRNTPDPDEYVRIGPGQLHPRNGTYELRVTNELEETLFLDHGRLLAVDHPEGVEVHPAEGMTREPRAFRLFAARDLRVPRATDDRQRDWTPSVARADRRYAEGFALLPLRGYAERHGLILDLAEVPATHSLLLLTAWTDYAFSSDNVAAAQRGWGLQPPMLEVEDDEGHFVPALEVGVPVGRPQTIVLDLKD
ncbi:MAG TPA: FG-GAP-like repeat-containing protein, partial [Vicinamibacteria bacterium]